MKLEKNYSIVRLHQDRFNNVNAYKNKVQTASDGTTKVAPSKIRYLLCKETRGMHCQEIGIHNDNTMLLASNQQHKHSF